MNGHLSYFVFFVVITVVFLHHAYATWTVEPVVPTDGIRRSCQSWILFYDFEADPGENLDKARTRDRLYDQDVCIWAALYASFLTLFYQYAPINPYFFCKMHGMHVGIQKSFTQLKSTQKTCEQWIHLYGVYSNYPDNTWGFISRRNRMEDNYIALWSALYAQYVQVNKDRASTEPKDFCRGLGHDEQDLLFASIYVTLKDCREWLEFAGFTDNLEHNMNVLANLNEAYEGIMNEYIVIYSRELRQLILLDIGHNPVYINNLMRNQSETGFRPPEIFCGQIGTNATLKRRYKELIQFE